MKFASMRSPIVIASVVVGSVIPSQAFAEIDVLTGLSNDFDFTYKNHESTYTFNQSMILNSIGFVSNYNPLTGERSLSTVSYTLNGTLFTLNQGMLGDVDSNGLQWYTLANGGVSVSASSELKVTTRGSFVSIDNDPFPPFQGHRTYKVGVGSNNPNSNVTYNGMTEGSGFVGGGVTNSNIRVSPANPSSNVAPEPGSFALALTGGAALIGICIRRRRNAA
jgi:hypothetical protein